jgi:uroporphyrinogen decarboxylase
MPLTERDNYLRNATFRRPEWMPCVVSISDAAWHEMHEELEPILLRHPTLFPGFTPGKRPHDHFAPAQRAGEDYVDAWGCTWSASIDGLEGIVHGSPLDDWAKLAAYRPPDPATQWDREPADWAGAAARVQAAKSAGRLTAGGGYHGFFFLRLTYLRGFENLMVDMATEAPELDRLIAIVAGYNEELARRWLDTGIDVLELADDLGSQKAAVVSPRHFRRYLAPHYRSLVAAAHARGSLAAFHSDGYVMDIMDDLLATGIDVVNPQDLVNGIGDLERQVKGKRCIRLDVDRQDVVPFGKPAEIHALIEEEVRRLGSEQGGLELICGIYPPTPPENVEAVCAAMEALRTYWF